VAAWFDVFQYGMVVVRASYLSAFNVLFGVGVAALCAGFVRKYHGVRHPMAWVPYVREIAEVRRRRAAAAATDSRHRSSAAAAAAAPV
jgi:hypothetical protein